MRYGLIGNPLGHSWSPRIHALLGDYDYRAYPLEENEIAAFLAEKDLGGLNVTRSPISTPSCPYCAALSDAAREIGSVNTLARRPDGALYGDNTDCLGFCDLVVRSGVPVARKKALVLGSGGASLRRALCAADARRGRDRHHLPQRREQL